MNKQHRDKLKQYFYQKNVWPRAVRNYRNNAPFDEENEGEIKGLELERVAEHL